MIATFRWRRPAGRGLALLLMAIGAAAAPSPALAQAGATTCQSSNAKITEVYRVGDTSKSETLVRLGDKLAIVLDNATAFFAEAVCRKKAIVLVIDGQPTGNKLAVPAGPQDAGLVFFLRPAGGLRDFWTALLGRPDFDPRPIRVGVGIEEQPPLPGDKALRLEVLPVLWLGFWLAIFIVLVVLFFKSAKNSNILRDAMLDTEAPAGTEPAFSLSKTQGAWWFFVILACYLLIGIVTGDFTNSINSTAIILLGIGAGTVLGSAAIDSSKLNERKAALEQAKKDAAQASATNDAAALKSKEAEIEALRGESEGFLKDILSDGNGINFHRFQLAAWTVVLSIIFIKDVYVDLAMPTFSTTLMGLLGLSAGTYLGLKIPEPTKPTA
jgi:hypothetical protein